MGAPAWENRDFEVQPSEEWRNVKTKYLDENLYLGLN